MQDSSARRQWRARAGLALLLVGLACLGFGFATSSSASPEGVRVSPDGTTAVPRTHFYQNQWVLFGSVEDPRRVPDPDEIGCLPVRGLRLPAQPADMTQFGSRVVESDSIAALVLLSRSAEGASIRCEDAEAHEPLWLLPSSEAPPFTSTGIVILGFMLLVAAALAHPSTADLPFRWRSGRSERRD